LFAFHLFFLPHLPGSVVSSFAASHVLSTHSTCLAPAAETSVPSAASGAALEAAGGSALPLQVSLHTPAGSFVVAVYRSRVSCCSLPFRSAFTTCSVPNDVPLLTCSQLRTLDFVFTAQKGCPLHAALFPAIRRLADAVLAQYPGCQYVGDILNIVLAALCPLFIMYAIMMVKLSWWLL
jgi:hypothetical protein